MDRLTALVSIAHLRLRLEILNRHPEYRKRCFAATFRLMC
jgi:hypothetical protein